MTSNAPSDAEILAAMMAAPTEAWDRLWAIADTLSAEADQVTWQHPERGEPLYSPFPLYSSAASRLQSLVDELGLISSFDWMRWPGSQRYRAGTGLASAPAADAARPMTAIVRGERFCEGTIAEALRDGTLTAVLARARRWFDTERFTNLGEVTDLLPLLESDLLFAASQSSKELFHSNMLAWYLRAWPQARTRLMQAWDLPSGLNDDVRVRREWRHLDLLVESCGHPILVVENKVFALPDEEQLRRYSKIVQDLPGSPALVLLSLTDPGWPDDSWSTSDGATWIYRSYSDLAAVSRPLAADISHQDRFAGEMLTRWMDLLDTLRLVEETLGRPSSYSPLLLPEPFRRALGEQRLDAAVQKMRCQHLAVQLRQDLETDADRLRIRADLTRGTGLIEAFAGNDPDFGWQLQGEDFRLAIQVGSQAADRGQAAVAAQDAAYFDFSQLKRLIPSASHEHPAPDAPTRYLGFAPNFVYRYVKVPSITAGQVQELSAHYSRRAMAFTGATTSR